MKATIAIDHSVIVETGLTAEQFQEAVITALSSLNCPLTGNPIYFNGVQALVEVTNQSTLIQSEPLFISIDSNKQEMTEPEMKARISLLAGEMDANEEENKFMQIEIDSLYAKLDAAKTVTT